MRFTRTLAITAGVLAAGALSASEASSKADKAQEELSKYEKTGDSVSCLMLRSIRDTDILDDFTMLVKASGKTYLNEMSGRCSGLAREGRYVHRAAGSGMCQGDIIQVIDSFGTMRGSCSLGEFEELSEIDQAQ
ncbi:hypothetical protein [Hyphococcus sp.]|uniref:hypothetical protein n=1 Tax=Hyphococcus sp. TaxID=2038636 RepID=UPI00207E2DAA|nr:MAG: hypothetical protein DHS20C04_26040 [Marinicaulis sp.]